MNDLAGKVYFGLGGVILGISGSTIASGWVVGFPGWNPASAVLLVGVGVLALYAFCAVLWTWPLPFRDSTLKRKLHQARDLAREIGTWADRKLVEHSSTDTIHLGTLEEDGRYQLSGAKFDEEARRRAIQSAALTETWNRQYSTDALRTYDFLVEKGAPEPTVGRLLFERPVNIGQIAAIARELDVMAAHLEVL